MVETKDQGKNINTGKTYAQASNLSTNISDVLKIKESFPSLNARRINQINSIVNS